MVLNSRYVLELLRPYGRRVYPQLLLDPALGCLLNARVAVQLGLGVERVAAAGVCPVVGKKDLVS